MMWPNFVDLWKRDGLLREKIGLDVINIREIFG